VYKIFFFLNPVFLSGKSSYKAEACYDRDW